MGIVNEILMNRVLIAAFLGYFIAQIVKGVIELIMNKEFSLSRLFVGHGGMPSSHSSTVCALALTSGFEYGFDSFAFAVSVVFAIIVMGDARGVRRETGTQAVVLNEIMEYFSKMGSDALKPKFANAKLKELIGHTPAQVNVGGLLGIVIALFLHFTFWV